MKLEKYIIVKRYGSLLQYFLDYPNPQLSELEKPKSHTLVNDSLMPEYICTENTCKLFLLIQDIVIDNCNWVGPLY